MIHWAEGTVVQALDSRPGVQELRVRLDNGETGRAILYKDEHRPARIGDRVLLNATGVNLGLGSGGYYYVHACLARADDGDGAAFRKPAAEEAGAASHDGRTAGHMMKLRYTSLQRSVFAAEEEASPHHRLFTAERTLEGAPVLIGELHSMLPVAAAWLRRRAGRQNGRELSIAYVMSEGGALPLSFSRHAVHLKKLGWIAGTVTYGHAYGGDVETMNKFTALLAARHILKADIIIAAMGPGIAGTSTILGHTGVETGEIANAAAKLGGVPVLMPRLSFADRRQRHHGLSDHVLTVLRDVVWCELELPLPESLAPEQKSRVLSQWVNARLPSNCRMRWVDGIGVEEVAASLADYPEPVLTMGRGLDDDPAFYCGVCAAAELACASLPSD